MEERKITISHKDLTDLLRYGKTRNKFDFDIHVVVYDAESEEYVTIRIEDSVSFIEVKE
jgi:hypothetical protein